MGGTLYIGVTNDLVRRVYEHRQGLAEGFTKKHGVHRLVHFEQFDDIKNAIRREKRLKSWNRAWKIRLIEQSALGRSLLSDCRAGTGRDLSVTARV
jgi:putative endonuclease